MVRRLRETYGGLLVRGTEGGPAVAPRLTWHAFPSVSSLAASSVEDLYKLGGSFWTETKEDRERKGVVALGAHWLPRGAL